ncbi:MAG TPA: hypothetical protein VJL89_05840, partial [Thermodesulfovibrionia bacterium]|nr:hypothetical protein [Thermodesulfovibrionia bacterium]
MKNINKFITIVFLILFNPLIVTAATMSDFTVYPAFVTTSVPPNILLILDHSGSMQFTAYLECSDYKIGSHGIFSCGSYTTADDPAHGYKQLRCSNDTNKSCTKDSECTTPAPAGTCNIIKDYYGYFKSDKYYRYDAVSNKFVQNDTCAYTDKIGGPNCMSGNLLNWISMSRIDAMRKVMIGGKDLVALRRQETVNDNGIDKIIKYYTIESQGGEWDYGDGKIGCAFSINSGVGTVAEPLKQQQHLITI